MRPFISRYPAFLAASPEFCDSQQALEPELLDLWTARDSALDQLCVETATWGLPYWERTLGIPVDEGNDLATRRSRVRVKLLGVDVTTVALVRSSAEIYSGQKAQVTEYPDQFRMEISFVDFPGIPLNMRDLTASLREIMPAHLYWNYLFSYDTDNTLKASMNAAAEFGPQLEVWPRSLRSLEATKPLTAAAATEHHSRLEIGPAEQEEHHVDTK